MVKNSARRVFVIVAGVSALVFCAASVQAASVGCDGAGGCYIRAASTCTSSCGTNWTNAYTGFGTGAGQVNPAAMQRGVTYWIAAGSYGTVNFSTPDSGTSVITIEAATTANHGATSDWNNAYAGQTLFSQTSDSNVNKITTDYWTIDGQTRGSDWQSGYNIKFWNQTATGGSHAGAINVSGTSNVSLRYVELEGTGMTGGTFPNNSTADKCTSNWCGVWTDFAVFTTSPTTNLYVGYCYAHHTGNTTFQMNVGISNSPTFEYNWIGVNHTGQNGTHDEAFAIMANSIVIRYNVFQDICGSGIIVDASAAQNISYGNWFVYGNLFFNDPAYLTLGQVYELNTVDQGILVFGDNWGSPYTVTLTGTILFANNTIANFDPAGVAGFNTYSTTPVGAWTTVQGTPTVIIENNLWYASAWVYGNYTNLCDVSGVVCTQDYNASWQGSSVLNGLDWQVCSTGCSIGGSHTPGPHDYNASGTSSPFLGAQPGTTLAAYQLTSSDPFTGHTGVTLASPYNFDGFNQLTRGANGVWDRGAEQLSNGSTAPLPPTNLQVTSVQ